MIKKPHRLIALALAAVVAIGLVGCAAPASKEEMVPSALATAKRYPYAIRVTTEGGAETGAMGSSNVSNEDIKAALETSIAKSQLFKSIVQTNTGDYELAVAITQIDKPIMGFSFTVKMETAWSLTKVSDRSVVMRRVVRSSHTTGATESLIGVKRLQMALEGAVRNNIAEGLTEISKLPI